MQIFSTLFPLSFLSFLSLFLFWKIGENSQIRIRPWGPFWHLYLFPSSPPAGPFSFSLAQHPFTLVSLPSGSRGEPTHMVPSPCHATSTFFPSYKASLGAPATLDPLPSPSQPPPCSPLFLFPLCSSPPSPWPKLEAQAPHRLQPSLNQAICPRDSPSFTVANPHLGSLFSDLGVSETSSPRACPGAPRPAAVVVHASTSILEPKIHVYELRPFLLYFLVH